MIIGAMTAKQKLWMARIDEWKRSGVSQRRYCEENDLSRGTFRWRRKRLKEHIDETTAGVDRPFVEIPVDRAVRIESKLTSELRITVGAYTIVVAGAVDHIQLRSVLNVLEGR